MTRAFSTACYLAAMDRAESSRFDRHTTDLIARTKSHRMPPGAHHPERCGCFQCEGLEPEQKKARREHES